MRWLVVLMALVLSGTATADPAAQAWLNAFRTGEGLAPLTASPQLEAAARAHGQDMARNGFFSHTGSNGSDLGARLVIRDYGFCVAAENIAMGHSTLTEALQSWAGSPPHRKNMASPEVTEFGLARAPGDIWVMVLGRPGC